MPVYMALEICIVAAVRTKNVADCKKKKRLDSGGSGKAQR
jgi:hypothetical protein